MCHLGQRTHQHLPVLPRYAPTRGAGEFTPDYFTPDHHRSNHSGASSTDRGLLHAAVQQHEVKPKNRSPIPTMANGPHAPTIEQHTHHKVGRQGNECIACHMLKIEQTIADVNVRSHTFHFVPPAMSDALKILVACNACHADKSTAWATAALKSWADRSPWRMAE